MERGNFFAVDFARQDFVCEASERYKGYVFRSRLKRVPNEAMKFKSSVHEKEVRRFPSRYIESVKSLDGRVLVSNRKMQDAFRAHFRDRFVGCPNLPVQDFCSYLANFPHLREAETAICEGVVTECGIHDAVKQVGHNKSPGLDGLPNEVYLRLPHIFVTILTDMFNHWFAQGAIPGSVMGSR